MAEQGTPVFDIRLGASSVDSRVLVNGQDISHSLRGVHIECLAGDLTRITLIAHRHHCVTVAGAIADVKITEAEWADLGRPDDPKGEAA